MKSKSLPPLCWGSLLLCTFLFASPSLAQAADDLVDTITFGQPVSETAHQLTADHSQIITNSLNDLARILLPLPDPNWAGGTLLFVMKVDPTQPNYATVRLWGSDATRNQLVLFCEGKQIGYRHLGDLDILDAGDGEPAFPGRFIYTTTPLPLSLTKGKTELHFAIRSYGSTWPYANDFAKFQNPLAGPTRGIYRFYTHTNGFFNPPADETQGNPILNPPVRPAPGPEVMDQLKTRVNKELNRLLTTSKPLNEMQMQFLARAYFVPWTPAFQNPQVVTQVIKGLDALYLAYEQNPDLAHNDPTTPNPNWFEFGPAGQAISLLATPLQPSFDGQIDEHGNKIPRRQAWSKMLIAGRDWHRQHRRLYTNQSMITDMNIYLSNRALEVLDPTNALSESEVRRYLYEAVGLEPWRDSDPGSGSRSWGVGTNYWELTNKGLTKELGFVGYYGEVLDWVTLIYDATRPTPNQPGDGKIKLQLEKIANARAPFRTPGTDADGFRAMRAETVVGWRDPAHYPGNVTYGERPTWDASTLYTAANTLDECAIGYAQQMFADNQFFISLEREMAQADNLRVTAGLLGVPEQYELVKSQPPSAKRLPMTPGQPDFVFSDEEDGVVAIKNGDEILYASLYWRSRNAVNSLARVHYTTPHVDQIAVVHEDTEFTSSGLFYTRPDNIGGAAPGGVHFPGDLHSANAGEQLPIAKVPAGVRFRPGDENVYAGKADFYSLRYDKYLIAMNLTTDKTFDLKTPSEFTEARELVSGKTLQLADPLKVAPRSTLVLWLGK